MNDWSGTYRFYVKDHLGNNRMVVHQRGTIEQVNNYYPYGGLMSNSSGWNTQRYKYNGKEFDRMHGLDWYDFGARWMDACIGRWHSVDPLCEKYYNLSPYVYCAGNPVNYIDLHGDSITMDDQSIMAIYNGLKKGHNITMKFNNGVLDPSSIEEQVKSSSDTFLQDLYEIATNKQMVELAVTSTNDYYMNGEETVENWNSVKDYDIQKDENLSEIQRQELMRFMPSGLTYMGNGGQTLYPKNSNELKRSLNNNIRININNLTNINHRSCAIAHEFGHVVLYLRHLPHSHPIADKFIYGRQWNVMQRLGYDYY